MCSVGVALTFAQISGFVCLWWGGESWCHTRENIARRCGRRSIRRFFSFPSQKVGRNWWLMLPFPRPPCPGLVTGVTSHLFPCSTHWCSSLFTILSCLLPAGAVRKPEGGFLGLVARGGTWGIPDLTKEGGEKPKKKNIPRTNTHKLL